MKSLRLIRIIRDMRIDYFIENLKVYHYHYKNYKELKRLILNSYFPTEFNNDEFIERILEKNPYMDYEDINCKLYNIEIRKIIFKYFGEVLNEKY